MSVFGKMQLLRALFGFIFIIIANGMCVLVLCFTLTQKAQAQFFDGGNDPPFRAPVQRDGGFFENLFGGFGQRRFFNPRPYENRPLIRRQYEPSADDSRAPAPRQDKTNVAPTTSILVMGDGMADWLAYGLEDAFSDSSEIAIVRKNKSHSGLLRYESKGDLDWWHAARNILSQEKADYVVMMLGMNDRQNMREKDIAEEIERKAKDQQAISEKSIPKAQQAKNPAQPAALERTRPKANSVVEFRSQEWVKAYSDRIDEMIAALKSKGIPVFWVGLPPIRGVRSTADAGFLNDLYRARAERAGIIYIDVWDGFVDEAGKYSTFGPDYDGQVRRLRSSDGVFFTKYGAQKLAHYVEREIRRYMNSHISVALPSAPGPLPHSQGKPAERPLAGPVVPLTAIPDHADTLLGGAASAMPGRDAIAAQALVKGEPVPMPRGRADDFMWSGAGGNELMRAMPESKSPMSAEFASVPDPAPRQAATEKNKIKKVKTSKSDKKTRDTQNVSVKHSNRQQPPRGRPGQNGPFPPGMFFPFFGQ